MQNKSRVPAILIAVTVAMPAAAGAESIRDAGKRVVMTIRPQTQPGPVFRRSTRAPSLRAIRIGAEIGCVSMGYMGYQFGREDRQEMRGLAVGCLVGAAWGAAIGYVVSAR